MLNVINSNEKTEGQLFAETELNYYALQVVTKYENLIKLYENNKRKFWWRSAYRGGFI